MIAVAQPEKPKLSSKEARAIRKASRIAGLVSMRAVHRLIDEEQRGTRLIPSMSNKAMKLAKSIRLAVERKACNKVARLARRPRRVVSQDGKTFVKMIRSNTIVTATVTASEAA